MRAESDLLDIGREIGRLEATDTSQQAAIESLTRRLDEMAPTVARSQRQQAEAQGRKQVLTSIRDAAAKAALSSSIGVALGLLIAHFHAL